ncbi:MAG: hypothetical protein ACFFE4_19805, partial [Candidatus Thorarchaeota archaeon]
SFVNPSPPRITVIILNISKNIVNPSIPPDRTIMLTITVLGYKTAKTKKIISIIIVRIPITQDITPNFIIYSFMIKDSI